MAYCIVPLAGLAAVVFAALMVAQRSLYAAAMCFLAVIMQTAVMLCASGAKQLALLLVLIYAGAVAVLIVISIQAAGGPAKASEAGIWSPLSLPKPLAIAGFLFPLLEFAALLARGSAQVAILPSQKGDLVLGPALFGPYALAAEAVALIMLFAALAVVITDRKGGVEGER